jgi:hypothetical protein
MADKKAKKTRKAKPATRKAVAKHDRDDEPTAVETPPSDPEPESEPEEEPKKVPPPKVRKVVKSAVEEKTPLATVRLKEGGPDRYTFQGRTYFKGAPVPIAGREQIDAFKKNGFFIVAEG